MCHAHYTDFPYHQDTLATEVIEVGHSFINILYSILTQYSTILLFSILQYSIMSHATLFSVYYSIPLFRMPKNGSILTCTRGPISSLRTANWKQRSVK